MGCPCMTAIFVGLGGLAVYLLYKFLTERALQKRLERWSNTPKDLVILHGFPPGKTIPSSSPFVLKVQTYLRMANIKHEFDTKDPFGPKGKAPWISINGQHIADSEFIIEFLNKKFEKNLNGKVNEKAIAVASALRVMLDEHFIWGVTLERISCSFENLKKVMEFPWILWYYLKFVLRRRAKAQGVGVHSQSEVERIMCKDLRIVSAVLGSNKFICGDEPCEVDAGIFGELAQCVWGMPGSSYEKLVNGELKNLKDYCIRMKERVWLDWDQNLTK